MLFPACERRDLTLQGGVIHVTFMLQSSFFCLETKERSKEKFKADLFSPTRSLHCAKGQKLATLKQSALFDASVTGARLTGEKVGRRGVAGGVVGEVA